MHILMHKHIAYATLFLLYVDDLFSYLPVGTRHLGGTDGVSSAAVISRTHGAHGHLLQAAPRPHQGQHK